VSRENSLNSFSAVSHIPHCLRLSIHPSAISNVHSTHPLVTRIHTLLTTLLSIPLSIKFMWVPSHKGIQGNESVDSAAKTATNFPEASLVFYPQNLISPSLYANIIITNHWISFWQKQAPSNKLAEIKVLPFSWSSSHQTHRRHEIYLTRLRIGHTRIIHAHLLSNLFPLSCEHCNLDSPLTVNHMFECPVLTALRLFHHVPHSLKASLSKDSSPIPNIFSYLHAANILLRI